MYINYIFIVIFEWFIFTYISYIIYVDIVWLYIFVHINFLFGIIKENGDHDVHAGREWIVWLW